MNDVNFTTEYLNKTFSKYQKNFFLVDDLGDSVRYADVLSFADSTEVLLTKNKLVLAIIENDLNALKGYFSLLLSGAVILLASSSDDRSRLGGLVSKYQPRFLWVRMELLDCLSVYYVRMRVGAFCLVELNSPDIEIYSGLRLLLSTSGSTGSSKYVRLSDQNIISNASSIVSYLRLTEQDRPITVLPPTYSFGLSILQSHALVGATIYVTKRGFFDKEFWQFARERSITSISGVPYHFQMLRRLNLFSMNLEGLSALTQAGGRLPLDDASYFAFESEKRNIRFYMMYGQTEATARIAFLPPEKAISKVGSIGQAIPGGTLELKDESGNPVNEQEGQGELIYRGPNVCLGYAFTDADLRKGDDNKGRLLTGDIARRDRDGDYFIVGRRSRFLKIYGNRVSLDEIDGVLERAGVSGACNGKDDQLEIYVTTAVAGDARAVKKLVQAAADLPPKSIHVYSIGSLPRNDSGKILSAKLHPSLGERLE